MKACNWVALAVAAVLGGCAVGPDFQRPEAPQVGAFTRSPLVQAAPSGEALTAVDAQWWRAYGSGRVNDLVARALARNPGLAMGLANLRQAQENVNAQRGLYFPQVQAGYGANRQKSGSVLSSPLSSGDSLFTLHTAQLSVGFVPDVFGANRRQVESLQASANSQRLQLDAMRLTLTSNVVSAAVQERSVLQQIDVLEEALKVAKEQLLHAQRLKQSGYTSALDLAQQEAMLAQTEAMLPPLRKQLELTRNVLAVLCGDFPAMLQAEDGGPDIQVPEHLPGSVPSRLVEQRPDVQAATEDLHAATALIGVAVANRLPQLSLSGSLGYASTGLGDLLSGSQRVWSLLGGFTMPVFNAGTLSARQRAAEAAAQASAAQYRSVVLTAFQNVADTMYSLEHDAALWKTTQRAELAMFKQLELTRKQHEMGYVAQPQWLSARQSWLQAKQSRILAQTAYLGDTVALYQSLGGGWQGSANLVPAAD